MDCQILLRHWPTNNDSYLCLIEQDTYFHGSAEIFCIFGQISCFGAKFSNSWSTLTMLTPHQLLHIRPVKAKDPPKSDLLEQYMDKQQIDDVMNTISPLNDFSLVVFRPRINVRLKICTNFMSAKSADSNSGPTFTLTSFIQEGWSILDDSFRYYSHVAHDILRKKVKRGPLVVIFAGAANTGKSSLLRYCINRSLQQHKRVVVVDGDVGQSEFTPPGVISSSFITNPYFGQSFNNEVVPSNSTYYGGCSFRTPTRYRECLRLIMTPLMGCDNLVFVNTMGYSTGLGVVMMADVIKICDPTFVVQLNCRYENRNFLPLTKNFIRSIKSGPKRIKLKYNLIEVDDIIPWRSKTFFSNLDYRELSTLCYLFKNNLSLYLPNLLLSSSTVCFYFSNVAVCVHGIDGFSVEQFLMALSGTWVSLCKVEEDKVQWNPGFPFGVVKSSVICPCLGFGIVRSIDTSLGCFSLICPETAEVLSQVNLIYRGTEDFPPSIRTSSGNKDIPYMSEHIAVLGNASVFRIF